MGRDPITGHPVQIHRTFEGGIGPQGSWRSWWPKPAESNGRGPPSGSYSTVAPTTFTGYGDKIEHAIRPALGEIRLDKLGRDTLDRWYRHWREQG